MIARRWLPATFVLFMGLVVGGDLARGSQVASGNDAQNNASNDAADTPVVPVAPLLKWQNFDNAEAGQWQGEKRVEPTGPRPPAHPNFPAGNPAAFFPGDGTSLRVREDDLPDTNLRFGRGESITLECWVHVAELRDGQFAYLIGKGRHKSPKFSAENQNYALRLKGEAGEARPSFLFRSAADETHGSEYHRWTASEGFGAGTGWHHVAVTYTFGQANSLHGYVDGKEVAGTWDMAGKTDRAPVTDGDDLVLGTGNGGGAGNSLQGWLDEVAIYRAVVPEAVFASRYQFIPPRPAVDAEALPAGRVLVQICEQGVPARNAWPPQPPTVTETYYEDAFGLFEVPQKYVDTGVRDNRTIPYLLRAAAKVDLPVGKHRLLLRGRGATQLYVNGQKTLTISFPPGDGGGHGHVAEQQGYLNLGPAFRFAPPGTQEAWCEFESRGGEHIVILETLVGGVLGKSRRRPELGELVVAWSPAGSDNWELVSPGSRRIVYTDAGWQAYESERRQWLEDVNQARREEARAQHATFWNRRRQLAAEWLQATPDEPVPPLPAGYPAHNEIDRFLAAKMARVAAQTHESAQGTVDFYRDVQPLLEAKCYDCHRGGKPQGGLRLDHRLSVLRGGESEEPAVVPGKPDESTLLTRIAADDPGLAMPPKGERLSAEERDLLTRWIREGARWPEIRAERIQPTPLVDDLTFLRRATLDTIGVVPSAEEISTFLADTSPERRARAVDRLLADRRWADHGMGYWQDVLAENPNILNPTLNNTGPFRWWLYESLLDNKPLDLFVTELLRMRGSERFGGPAGFGVASQNDVPMAAKGTIISAAFLGVEMKCARCHDSPANASSQRDLFELAAMLSAEPLTVPATSSVSAEKLTAGGRKPLISVTLETGTRVEPRWPFDELLSEAMADVVAEHPSEPRDRLAALITAPHNERFAQVMANRVWRRLMGRGIVEPVDDWEKNAPTHPELLRWLGRELVRSGYDVKHVTRLILNSHAYQRATDGTLKAPSPLFTAPAPRRLDAEQIVDSLFAATGKPFRLEEVSLDIDGRRDMGNSISLGQPRRSWMLTSTSNERDRPSLNLPRIQAVTDVLSAFGWRGARQDPLSVRDTAPNALQPAILSNGTMSVWLTRLSDDHGLTQLALHETSAESLVRALYLRILTRAPRADELAQMVEHLQPGFASRVRSASDAAPPAASLAKERRPALYVSWSNHLDPEATLVRQRQEAAARQGDPPTGRLESAWRERLEDVVWVLLNSPEFVFAP